MFGLEIINSVVFTRSVALDLTNRRQKKTDFLADSFVGLWVNLIINANNSSIFGGKRLISKEVEKFFKQPILLDAIQQAGESAENCLLYELTDSARIYFLECKTDSHYGSNMLGLIKLKEKEIANKTA
jgi:hypothetical protein